MSLEILHRLKKLHSYVNCERISYYDQLMSFYTTLHFRTLFFGTPGISNILTWALCYSLYGIPCFWWHWPVIGAQWIPSLQVVCKVSIDQPTLDAHSLSILRANPWELQVLRSLLLVSSLLKEIIEVPRWNYSTALALRGGGGLWGVWHPLGRQNLEKVGKDLTSLAVFMK